MPCAFLILGLPASDIISSIVRRLAHKKSPFSSDRGHLHHKLIDMGFSPRASVLILYAMSALLGICAVMFTTDNVRIAFFILIIGIGVLLLDFKVLQSSKEARKGSGVIIYPEKFDETKKKALHKQELQKAIHEDIMKKN